MATTLAGGRRPRSRCAIFPDLPKSATSFSHLLAPSSTNEQVRKSAAIPANYTGRPWGWNDMDMLESGNYEQAAHANGKESNMTSLEYAPLPTARGDL